MSNKELTSLLLIILAITVIALLTTIFVYVLLLVNKKRNKNNQNNKDLKENNNESKKEVQKNSSNIIQAKTYTSEDIKKFIDFDEIKDNMIIQKNGKRLVMVVQCQGINYDLMSSIEKVSVEQGFVQFLNTLTTPIQLHIQARKVNLEESIFNYKKRLKVIETNYSKIKLQYEQAQKDSKITQEVFKKIRLEYIRQKNLYEYTKDIISNTESMSLNKHILTKNYYIALSYYPDNKDDLFKKEELIDMAFSELYTNAQAMLRTLSVCGVTGKVLDSVELADLLYVGYNRDYSEIYGIDKAIRAGYDALYTTAPDVIDKKIKELDKMIDERALNLANQVIDKVTLKNKRQKELEQKEKQIDDIIKDMAKNIIKENKDYISEEVVEESIKEIDSIKEIKSKETKLKKVKK